MTHTGIDAGFFHKLPTVLTQSATVGHIYQQCQYITAGYGYVCVMVGGVTMEIEGRASQGCGAERETTERVGK